MNAAKKTKRKEKGQKQRKTKTIQWGPLASRTSADRIQAHVSLTLSLLGFCIRNWVHILPRYLRTVDRCGTHVTMFLNLILEIFKKEYLLHRAIVCII